MMRLIILFIFYFIFSITALAESSKPLCYQWSIVSLYKNKTQVFYQQSVASTILWKNTQTKYLLGMAHAVSQAEKIIAICDQEVIELSIAGINESNDIALLYSSKLNLYEPLFELPQDDFKVVKEKITRQGSQPSSTESNLLQAFSSEKWLNSDRKKSVKKISILADDQYEAPTLLHPLFRTLNISEETLKLEGDFSETWKAKVNKTLGTYTLQSNQRIRQFIYKQCNEASPSTLCDEDPFLNLNSIRATIGIRPGMSGSPLFEWMGNELNSKSVILIGVVSKTKLFQSETLLIPTSVIQKTIQEFLSNTHRVNENWSLHYMVSPHNQTLIPYLASSDSKKIYFNFCDNDYRNSAQFEFYSDLKQDLNADTDQKIETLKNSIMLSPHLWTTSAEYNSSQIKNQDIKKTLLVKGGDHGDGSGSFVKMDNYIISPHFTGAIYAPEVSCDKTGIIDNTGKLWTTYSVNEKIYPMRNLDTMIAAIRTKKLKDANTQLISAGDSNKVFNSICRSAASKNQFDYSFSGSESKANSIKSTWAFNSKNENGYIIFRDFFRETDDMALFKCIDSAQLITINLTHHVYNSPSSMVTASVAGLLDSQNKNASLSIQIGNCQTQEAQVKFYGPDLMLKTQFGSFQLSFLENKIEFRGAHISPDCGVSQQYGAFDIEFSTEPNTKATKSMEP